MTQANSAFYPSRIGNEYWSRTNDGAVWMEDNHTCRSDITLVMHHRLWCIVLSGQWPQRARENDEQAMYTHDILCLYLTSNGLRDFMSLLFCILMHLLMMSCCF